jgi:8-oxo-dGTP pyrophosphatase MutT (NUDIX family)
MEKKWIAPSAAVAAIAGRLVRVLAAPARAYAPFMVDGKTVGWITPERATRLVRWRSAFRRSGRAIELAPSLATSEERTAALDEVTRTLSTEGALTAWRDERYTVVPECATEPLFVLERAAARYFGIHTFAAHANGLTGRGDDWQMWLARRSPTKPIDPGLLDNLVGGGIAEGSDAAATLVKEAWEEAGLPADLARHAQGVGSVDICRDQPDGLQRETIFVHDLWLPTDFLPTNQDSEAVEHRLCSPEVVLSILASDDITADASLVIVDFLLRSSHIAPGDPASAALEALCHPSASTLRPTPP